jgi:acyl-CoA thioesterase FadM
VIRIGTSSFTVRCAVSQDARPAASVDVVLVRYGYDERKPLPLSPQQRVQLERVTVPG